MRVHIVFEFKNISGGGNQFLKAIKNYLVDKGLYSEHYQDADVIVFNSYQYIDKVIKIKKEFPKKVFIHRIDGPIRLYQNMNDKRDSITNTANELLADGTIFQSKWSQKENYRLGIKRKEFETTIINAPNPSIFNSDSKSDISATKTRLIATSWSDNWKKGFAYYKWLDEHLDFDKYSMTFIGRSPIEFSNIVHLSPMTSEEIAFQLAKHDVFITASEKDPCSNSLLEALHSGLPVVALNDGGHPELVGTGGKLFSNKEEIVEKIETCKNELDILKNNIQLKSFNETVSEYVSFFEQVNTGVKLNERRKLSKFSEMKIRLSLWKYKLVTKLR